MMQASQRADQSQFVRVRVHHAEKREKPRQRGFSPKQCLLLLREQFEAKEAEG